MSATSCVFPVALLSLLAACAARESDAPEAHDRAPLRADFGSARGLAVHGVAEVPPIDTDQLPQFELFIGDRALAIIAVDATIDRATGSLAWIDPVGTLWVAPLDAAPANKRGAAERVIPGLSASRGRLAFATRIDGPETAPFVLDLRTLRRIALDDGPGPDEVLGFSPDGDEVLVLSGRTGLASLFALGVDPPSVRQLTNIGLVPGPSLDTTRIAPTPVDRRDVAWGRRGIAYRAEHSVIWFEPGRDLERLDTSASVEEVVR